ncbi:MAG: FixH family protein, partial [SAR202 cluster bacterium]|nr:FixH family protein [SAR202 cluster bacterium]
VPATVASAHGKELTLEVTSMPSDPDQPLARLFRVMILYAGDRDPVDGARVQLSADRQGGGPAMEPVFVEPLNQPGLYAAEMAFPLFGSWNVTLEVVEFGEGEVTFVEEVLPADPTQTTNNEVRQQVLDLFFRFDWKDVASIAVRVGHILGGTIWLGITGLILAAFWFMPRPARAALFYRLSRIFMPATITGLLALTITGIYTGIYSAPINPPGIFDIDIMMEIPFGPQYMATMIFKIAALITYGIIAVPMSASLRAASVPVVAGGGLASIAEHTRILARKTAEDAERPLYRMALANAILGFALAVAITTAVYLHYISHLAVLIPN